ncbi:hypothetical protein CGT96_19120, partial [Vibrio metoecus]
FTKGCIIAVIWFSLSRTQKPNEAITQNLQRQIHCCFVRQRKTILNCRQNLNEMPKKSTNTTY